MGDSHQFPVTGQLMAGRSASVQGSFTKHGVVSDLLDKAPADQLMLRYGDGGNIESGRPLGPKHVQSEPEVHWQHDANSLYTLSMTDLDAPSRDNPQMRSVDHWLVVNIPGDNVKSGKTVIPYMGSLPDDGTGPHRYVFIVYRQKGNIEPTEEDAPQTRVNFNLKDFANKYELDQPVAGNFFLCQYDRSTPDLCFSEYMKKMQRD